MQFCSNFNFLSLIKMIQVKTSWKRFEHKKTERTALRGDWAETNKFHGNGIAKEEKTRTSPWLPVDLSHCCRGRIRWNMADNRNGCKHVQAFCFRDFGSAKTRSHFSLKKVEPATRIEMFLLKVFRKEKILGTWLTVYRYTFGILSCNFKEF